MTRQFCRQYPLTLTWMALFAIIAVLVQARV